MAKKPPKKPPNKPPQKPPQEKPVQAPSSRRRRPEAHMDVSRRYIEAALKQHEEQHKTDKLPNTDEALSSSFIGPVIQAAIDQMKRKQPTILPVQNWLDPEQSGAEHDQHSPYGCGPDCPIRDEHEDDNMNEQTEQAYCECGEAVREYLRERKIEAEEQLAGCKLCLKPRYHLPMPTGPVAPPLMRLVKSGPGVIGYPWVEVIAVAPGDPNRFYDTTRYLCRLPGRKAYIYKWFTHRDMYNNPGDYGEYDEE